MDDKELQALPLEDKSLVCVDCQRMFVFNVGEQRYFISKGLSVPKRCPKCRIARKLTLNTGGVS